MNSHSSPWPTKRSSLYGHVGGVWAELTWDWPLSSGRPVRIRESFQIRKRAVRADLHSRKKTVGEEREGERGAGMTGWKLMTRICKILVQLVTSHGTYTRRISLILAKNNNHTEKECLKK